MFCAPEKRKRTSRERIFLLFHRHRWPAYCALGLGAPKSQTKRCSLLRSSTAGSEPKRLYALAVDPSGAGARGFGIPCLTCTERIRATPSQGAPANCPVLSDLPSGRL